MTIAKPSVDMYRSSLHCLASGKYYSMWKFSPSYSPGDTELIGQDKSLALAVCDTSSQLNPNLTLPSISGLEYVSRNKNIASDSYEVNFVVKDSRLIILGVIAGLIIALEVIKRVAL